MMIIMITATGIKMETATLAPSILKSALATDLGQSIANT